VEGDAAGVSVSEWLQQHRADGEVYLVFQLNNFRHVEQCSGRAKPIAFAQVSHPDISALQLLPWKKLLRLKKQACKTRLSLQSAV